jgi:CRP-like cAMP-binding protein
MSPFVKKLCHGAALIEPDKVLLANLAQPVRRVDARRDILAEGTEPRWLPLIIEGWACRYRLLENGKRQLISIYLPGDLCEPFGVLPRFLDTSLGALTPVTLATVSLAAITAAAQASPALSEALWWDLLVGSAIEREHIVSLGRRSASERLGHFFCELQLRMAMVGLADESGYEMPLTQTDLADLLGLTRVHLNVSLQDLRRLGLISLRNHRLTIHDLQGLRERSLFDASYLHSKDATAR